MSLIRTKDKIKFDHSVSIARGLNLSPTRPEKSYYFGCLNKRSEQSSSSKKLPRASDSTDISRPKFHIPKLLLTAQDDFDEAIRSIPKKSVISIGDLYDTPTKKSGRSDHPPSISIPGNISHRRRQGSENTFLDSYLKDRERSNESPTKSRHTLIYTERSRGYQKPRPEEKARQNFFNYLKYLDKNNNVQDQMKFLDRLNKKSSNDNSFEDEYGFNSLLKLPPLPVIPKHISKIDRKQTESSNIDILSNPTNNQSPFKFSRNVSSIAEGGPLSNRLLIKRKDSTFNKNMITQRSNLDKSVDKSIKVFDFQAILPGPQKEPREFFERLAKNLNTLYKVVNNDKKVQNAINDLGNGNNKVIDFVSATVHKINDYDAEKLFKRFYNINDTTIVSQPSQHLLNQKRAKTRPVQTFQTIDQATMRALVYFNERLEEFILEKKKINLKQLENELKESEDKLVLFRRKRMQLGQKRKNGKDIQAAEKIILEKATIDPFQFFQFDPVTEVDNYTKLNGDLKFVDPLNLEHAKHINQIFNSWNHYKQDKGYDQQCI